MKLVLVLGRQMLLSRAVFVHVPESDAAMSAPSVRVYTEQRTEEEREQERLESRGGTREARSLSFKRLMHH